ncbi:hypothetical protein, partial [Novosphingobium aerophilum]|uniref:hypothetical protein n=1 Tax=Novosphingobium aerophilum TaxID=2839843 RepID=UPI001BE4B733
MGKNAKQADTNPAFSTSLLTRPPTQFDLTPTPQVCTVCETRLQNKASIAKPLLSSRSLERTQLLPLTSVRIAVDEGVGFCDATCHSAQSERTTALSKGFGRREAYESLTCTTRGRQALRYGDFGSAPWEM